MNIYNNVAAEVKKYLSKPKHTEVDKKLQKGVVGKGDSLKKLNSNMR